MADERIIDLLAAAERPLLSFEFFPPKTDAGMEKLEATAAELLQAHPDFVTVTWGAGGSTRARTLEVCQRLRDIGMAPVMPHLTCVGASRAELADIVEEIYALGFRNIMALRGDPPRGETSFQAHPDGLAYASELVGLIKNLHPDICCGVAGYPEVHPESEGWEADIRNLKRKLDAGGDFVTTQLFYDSAKFVRYYTRCRKAGITQMIIPGLLPVLSLKQTLRITEMCGASFPPPLRFALDRAGGEGPEAEQVGVDWAAWQIDGLLENHAPAIHLYVLNSARAALAPALARCFAKYR